MGSTLRWRAWCGVAAAYLCSVTAAAGTSDLFYIYDGPAVRDVTSALIPCWRIIEDGVEITPWGDVLLVSELMTELWVHRSLLEHPLRTTDPALATYFYIPGYFELSWRLRGFELSWGFDGECHGRNHQDRSSALVAELQNSPYFRRYGGSDHFTVCLSFNCRQIFTGPEHDVLSRVTVGNLEPGTDFWATWGCFNKVIGLPYVARTDLTAEAATRPPSQRKTSFFFRGSTRGRPERVNLVAAATVVNNSDIDAPLEAQDDKSKLDGSYTDHILQSRFCFAPRGDTPTSRRIYDAIAAGCIPVLQEMVRTQNDLPFLDQIPYDNFAIIAPDSDFETKEGIVGLAKRIEALSPEQVDTMHASLLQWRSYLVAAAGDASNVTSFMQLKASGPLGAAFYDHAVKVMSNSPFLCTPPPVNPLQDSIMVVQWDFAYTSKLQQKGRAQRLAQTTYPRVGRPNEWVVNGETKIDRSRQLLFCAVPGAGGEVMQAALIRGGAALQPLKVEERDLSRNAYSTDWVQITVVRDPIVRLLANHLQDAAASKATLTPRGFRDFVARLAHVQSEKKLDEEGIYRAQTSFCGMRYRSFVAELQAEELSRDAPKLLRGLGLGEGSIAEDGQAGALESNRAATALFSGCGWTKYYDGATLSLAAGVYSEDYARLPYYSVLAWEEALDRCEKDHAGFVQEDRNDHGAPGFGQDDRNDRNTANSGGGRRRLLGQADDAWREGETVSAVAAADPGQMLRRRASQ